MFIMLDYCIEESKPMEFKKDASSLKKQSYQQLMIIQNKEQRNSSIFPLKLPSEELLQKENGNPNQKNTRQLKIHTLEQLQEQTSENRPNKRLQDEKTLGKMTTNFKNKILAKLHPYILIGHESQLNKQYVLGLYDAVNYSLRRLKEPSPEHIKKKQQILQEGPKNHKKLLLLDLDETLVYKVETPDSENHSYVHLMIRPHTFGFLQALRNSFEICVFTSGTRKYAERVVRRLNRDHIYITDFLSRESCFETRKGVCVKDLRIILNRQLKDIVIIDNNVRSFGFQLDNGIPILAFKGQKHDDELVRLLPFLIHLSEEEDVRRLIRQQFQLKRILETGRSEIEFYFNSQ